MRVIKYLALSAFVAAIAVVTSSCNTTEGFGKDVEEGGRALKESAQDHND
jgi:predicted small secreted protein